MVCYNVIEHLTEDERSSVFKAIHHFLNKEGRIIFGYANPYNLLQLLKGFFFQSALFDPTHKFNWSIDEFLRIVGNRFNIISVKKTSPFTRHVWLSRHFKGDILLLCSTK